MLFGIEDKPLAIRVVQSDTKNLRSGRTTNPIETNYITLVPRDS